jgi:hypothetical protein
MLHIGDLFIVQHIYSSHVTYPIPSIIPILPRLQSPNILDTNPPYSNVMDNSFFYNVGAQNVIHPFAGPQHLEPLYLESTFTSQPTTAVLLPLLHEENYKLRVLLTSAVEALVVDLEIGTRITNA